jgi:hypothetical protein
MDANALVDLHLEMDGEIEALEKQLKVLEEEEASKEEEYTLCLQIKEVLESSEREMRALADDPEWNRSKELKKRKEDLVKEMERLDAMTMECYRKLENRGELDKGVVVHLD